MASRDLCSLVKKSNQKQHKSSSIAAATKINSVLFSIVLELDILFSSLFAMLVTQEEIIEDLAGLFLIGEKNHFCLGFLFYRTI